MTAPHAQYLRAMGIDVWQLRKRETDVEPVNVEGHIALAPAEESKTNPEIGYEIDSVSAYATVDQELVVKPAVQNKPETLDALKRLVSECRKCNLCETRTQTVFGVGNPNADWMLVGEAPGAEEDRQGYPFVGRAGQLLDKMLQAISLKRDDVYIANVLKCRPPKNRDPMGEEVRQCEPYLLQQIEFVQPKIILALGKFSAQSLMRSNESIGQLRGSKTEYADTRIPLMATYHPAYLLRNPIDKRKSWQDLLLAKSIFEPS